jgi:putative YjhG/YagF family dehydratase
VLRLAATGTTIGDLLGDGAIRNAMLVHAAFGGSTNLILHLTAVAREAGLRAPTVDDWIGASRATPRLVDALPNGPRNHPTVLVHLAGGVPEVLLHLRALGVVDLDVRTASGQTLGDDLAWWEASDERAAGRERLAAAGVDPDDVIAPPATAGARGLAPTLVFPTGNLAPHGSVVKATSIDASSVHDGVYRHRGPVRLFASGADAMRALKGQSAEPLRPGDVLVLAGAGPLGTGMAEIASITIALKLLPWGKDVAVVTDGRFSGVSTGPCVGHVSPEALAGGPLGRLRDGDLVEVVVDRRGLTGSVDLVGVAGAPCTPGEAARVLAERPIHPAIAPDARLPADTRLWALLQEAGGGVWGGCHYDLDAIEAVLRAGLAARAAHGPERAAPAGAPEGY